MKFLCIRKCFYKGHIFMPGEGIEVDKVIDCPECGGTGKIKGKECHKCHGTGRAEPSHHFKPVDEVKKAEVEEVVDKEAKLEELRAKCTEAGIPFDRRWGIERLSSELLNAEKSGINRAKDVTE